MSTIVIKILFFGLVPIGIVLLFFSIKSLKNLFYGTLVLELPYLLKTATFKISKAGKYAIWHKAKMFRKVSLTKFKPVIKNIETSESVVIYRSIFRPHINGFDKSRLLLFNFSLKEGNFQIDLAEGSSVSKFEEFLSKVLPVKEVDLSQYSIQVRKRQPFYITIGAILLTVAAAGFIIGGFVIGLLTEQIFS